MQYHLFRRQLVSYKGEGIYLCIHILGRQEGIKVFKIKSTNIFWTLSCCLTSSDLSQSTFSILETNLSIYLSRSLMLHSLWEHSPKGWPWQKSFHLSQATHSLLACLNPPPLVASHSHMYSFTLSTYLPSSLPLLSGPSLSLTYTFFSIFILSMAKLFHFHPFHFSTLHSI